MLRNSVTLVFILALTAAGCRPSTKDTVQVGEATVEQIGTVVRVYQLRLEVDKLQGPLQEIGWPPVGDFWLPGEFERMVEEKMRQRKTPEEDNV